MPGFRALIRAATGPMRQTHAVVTNLVQAVRKEAPAARMVGEFAVRMGVQAVGRRAKDPGRTQSED